MRTLWQSLIQPSLDYCSQLWCPDDQESINMIEAVQRQYLGSRNSTTGRVASLFSGEKKGAIHDLVHLED